MGLEGLSNESERINDPQKAEAMARAEAPHREIAIGAKTPEFRNEYRREQTGSEREEEERVLDRATNESAEKAAEKAKLIYEINEFLNSNSEIIPIERLREISELAKRPLRFVSSLDPNRRGYIPEL